MAEAHSGVLAVKLDSEALDKIHEGDTVQVFEGGRLAALVRKE